MFGFGVLVVSVWLLGGVISVLGVELVGVVFRLCASYFTVVWAWRLHSSLVVAGLSFLVWRLVLVGCCGDVTRVCGFAVLYVLGYCIWCFLLFVFD